MVGVLEMKECQKCHTFNSDENDICITSGCCSSFYPLEHLILEHDLFNEIDCICPCHYQGCFGRTNELFGCSQCGNARHSIYMRRC